MQRRSFITLLGTSAATWPLAARAQLQERVRRVGLFEGDTEDNPISQERRLTLRQTLNRLGWSEERNVRFYFRYTAGAADQYHRLAKELFALQPDVVLATTTPAVAALQQESGGTVPIVFTGVSDPIGSGFVASLARPGGNITGMLNIEASITGKWLAMVKEIAPHVVRIAFIANPKTTPYDYFLRAAETAARGLAIELVPSRVETPAEISQAIEFFARTPNGGLVLPPDTFIRAHRNLVIALAAYHRLPAAYWTRDHVVAGGLMSYGNTVGSAGDSFQRSLSYVDRILRGEKPADLPVQAPVKYETVLNLKTARALGLTVPDLMLVRADEVIE